MSHSETLLALVHPGIAILIALLLAAVARFDSRQRYFGSIALACLAYSAGILTQILLVPANLALNVALSGLLYMGAALLFCRGLLMLADRPVPWRTLWAILVLSLALRAWFTIFESDGVLRSLALQLSIMLMLAITSWRLRHLRQGMRFERILFWLVLGLTASFGLRTLLLYGRSADQYGYDGSIYWLSVQASFYAFTVVIALVLLMVAAGRAVNAVRQAGYLDSLTGLNNRSGFHARTGQSLASCERYGLIALDIDFFKTINDERGHVVGDKVLAMLGGLLKRQLQGQDIVARYGGEEFLVFLPDADAATTYRTAENLRIAIEQLDLSTLGRNLSCTASVGAHAFDATVPIDKAYREVDALLYKAKSIGRNQTCSPAGMITV